MATVLPWGMVSEMWERMGMPSPKWKPTSWRVMLEWNGGRRGAFGASVMTSSAWMTSMMREAAAVPFWRLL